MDHGGDLLSIIRKGHPIYNIFAIPTFGRLIVAANNNCKVHIPFEGFLAT